ncbi:polypyrimidine tract-binding protein 1-like isoform X2 [Convolutriloba macropyga]|uniref:polypyrimidine tract-binding protein 1-like isoform X2 n=1 Tax=Convolutriloba macropyga TaxID=536237 RepID=UPI003F51AD15
MNCFDDVWMKRGSDADLFAPTPSAVASVPATAAGHHYAAQGLSGASPHQLGAGGPPGAANQSMYSPQLATQLAALNSAAAAAAVAGSPSAAALSLPGYGGMGGNPAAAGANNLNIFSQVSPFSGNDAKKVKLDNFNLSGGGGAAALQQTYHASAGINQPQQQQPPQSLGNLGGTAPPSKFVTICNLPEGTTQPEIIGLGAKDGKIVAAQVSEMKRQGYLEFEEERMAVQMVGRCQASPPIHRGSQLSVSFGSAKDMKQVPTGGNSGGSNYMSSGSSHSGRGGSPPDNGMGMGGGIGGDERTVLRVIVEMGENQNIYSQVNMEVLHHLFTRTGFVMKIITFAKPGYPQQFQALIQYMDPKAAQIAKENYDGQNLYYGCCPLKVEYSKLTNLNVKYNNEKSRDFTRPDLPTGEPNTPSVLQPLDQTTLALAAQGLFPSTAATQFGLGAAAGGGPNQFTTLTNPAASLGQLAACGLSQPYIIDPATNLLYFSQPMATNAAFLQQLQRVNALAAIPGGVTQTGMVVNQPPTNSVLLVGNLNTEKVTCDGLFTLFGVYGDVQRVKILFNKQDSALIQMSSEDQANLAIQNLHEVKVYGREMRVSMSKHQSVQLPKEGQPDAGLTKDYSNSPLHRFRKQGSKNFHNIFPPSATLHLSNIAPGVSEEQVLEAFTKKNIEVLSFKFFPNDHKMALIQCRSREEAVIGLIEAHNYQLGENHHLRVSFSKTQMGMSSIANAAANHHAHPHHHNQINHHHHQPPSIESPSHGVHNTDGYNVALGHA